MRLIKIFKYFDCFGASFNFYSEKNRKLYTPLGGILTLLSCFFAIIVFIFINLDNLLHTNPQSTTSTARVYNTQVKFNEEKIWIPWRIRDYNGKSVNHSNFLYPIIFYYQGYRNDSKKGMNLTYQFLNYRLCNETSMINNTHSFVIDIDLSQLYCIDMGELNMGGNWDSDFINYVEFDLYICKNGIDYDENNINCTSYEKLIEAAELYNSFVFELFYPIINYQPMNKTVPIFISYSNYYYHLSRFSNKIDRIFLQKHILKDDKGWVIKKEKSYSYWGYISISGDTYANGDKRDLMNEGSTSRLYSFNIYLKPDIVFYNRSYKKLYIIFADGLPIINIVIVFFKLIAKIFKIASRNRKLTELLFENLQETKKAHINNKGSFTAFKVKKKKVFSDKRIMSKKSDLKTDKFNSNQNIIINNNDYSSAHLGHNELGKKITISRNFRRSSFGEKNIKSKFYKNPLNTNTINQTNEQNKLNTNTIRNNFNVYGNTGISNNNINISIHNNIGDSSSNKFNDFLSSNMPLTKMYLKKNISVEDKKVNLESNILKPKPKGFYIKKKLFPYKYYLCSIFIKDADISKDSFFFTKKFLVVYNFICQLFDISSYLILQKEFQTMKNTIMIGKYREIFENRQKINVNDHSFNTDIKECLDAQKFSILGKIINPKVY
mgnify:CR=1 FL=1